jgi:hypothetical protein
VQDETAVQDIEFDTNLIENQLSKGIEDVFNKDMLNLDPNLHNLFKENQKNCLDMMLDYKNFPRVTKLP